jgi:transposase
MPTVPRRPAAQRERDRLQARRLRAAELFAAGVRQAEVARQLEVSAQAVSVWHRRWRAGGIDGCAAADPAARRPGCRMPSSPPSSRPCWRATANGFTEELWTLERIAVVMERLTGVRYHPAWVWGLLGHRLGWSVQRPRRRATERDEQRSSVGSSSAGHRFCKHPTTQSLSGLLGRVRAQPDTECRPQLGAPRPAAHLDAPVQLEKASMAAALC